MHEVIFPEWHSPFEDPDVDGFVDFLTTKQGGFMKSTRPGFENCAVFKKFDSEKSPDEKRAFQKRVAKRRAKKGYRW